MSCKCLIFRFESQHAKFTCLDKDRLIDELKTENHALKHGPYSYDAATDNLRVAESTLAGTLDDKVTK